MIPAYMIKEGFGRYRKDDVLQFLQISHTCYFLQGMRIAENEIDGALQVLDDETQENTAKAILEKYMRNKSTDKETLYKAFRYLLGKGFEYETARNALSAFGDMEE